MSHIYNILSDNLTHMYNSKVCFATLALRRVAVVDLQRGVCLRRAARGARRAPGCLVSLLF